MDEQVGDLPQEAWLWKSFTIDFPALPSAGVAGVACEDICRALGYAAWALEERLGPLKEALRFRPGPAPVDTYPYGSRQTLSPDPQSPPVLGQHHLPSLASRAFMPH
jgi:hypothetical protein